MLTPGFVYILSNGFKRTYIGVTSDLGLRVWQHKNGTFPCSFTERYNIKQLVYFESFGDIREAINREKQLKRWSRIKKIGLIVAVNPDWRDMSEAWGKPVEPFDGTLREPVGFGDGPEETSNAKGGIQGSLRSASQRAAMLRSR